MQRNLKLFHRVVYPPTLRLFNTTDDADDPDRLYELYAVVVHIGGGPYHGHYVTVVKNDETGNWMLIDDEAVEAVDDGFVGRFYGDRPGMASAYVLFYQQVEQRPVEPVDAMIIPNGKPIPAEMPSITNGVFRVELVDNPPVNGHSSQNSPDPSSGLSSSLATLRGSNHIPSLATVAEVLPVQTTHSTSPSAQTVTLSQVSNLEHTPSKKEIKDAAKREKEERKEREKREKEAKQREKDVGGSKKLARSGLGTIKRWAKDKDKS